MVLTNQKKKTKSLVDHIKDMPTREKIVAELAEATKSHPSSVYRWLNGDTTPSPIKQDIIAEKLGMPASKLFPKKK